MAWTTPKTDFVPGNVLTADQMNAIGNNLVDLRDRDGLIFIKSQTVGTAVANVNVTSAFSSTYAAYKVVLSGVTASASAQGRLTFGATATGYYYSYNYTNYGSATNAAVSGSNAAFIDYAVSFEGSGGGNALEIINPNKAMWTRVHSQYPGSANTGTTTGVLQNTTAYTDFTITPTGGTLTGGKITVYGYANS